HLYSQEPLYRSIYVVKDLSRFPKPNLLTWSAKNDKRRKEAAQLFALCCLISETAVRTKV
ncbi:hypothetical protein, partial [Leptospira yasudae]|uniref:hypothetical protein n=1 Tax=Leptospira yasudae TaxID=2202201 RepID=UPI001AEF8982